MKIDTDVFINALIRELEERYQLSSNLMMPTQVIESIYESVKIAADRATTPLRKS